MKLLTKAEAIEWHKAMWEYVAEQIEEHGKYHLPRSEYKRRFIVNRATELGIEHSDDVLNLCFACEYAIQRVAEFENEDVDAVRDMSYDFDFCNYCPLNWKSCKPLYMCEDPHAYDWQRTDPTVIANLEERDG